MRTSATGVGEGTRRDERVCRGGQLRGRQSFQVEGLDLGTGIIRRFAALCVPTTSRARSLRAQRLPTWGHFVAHKDTPRDPEVFGTCRLLPDQLRGGRLVLSTRLSEARGRSLSLPSRAVVRDPMGRIYGDVDHAIEPVLDGTRITVTYPSKRPRSGPAPPRRCRRFADALALALADPRSCRRAGRSVFRAFISIPTPTPSRRRTPDRSSSRLKGRDRLVALAGVNAGLDSLSSVPLRDACNERATRSTLPIASLMELFRGFRHLMEPPRSPGHGATRG